MTVVHPGSRTIGDPLSMAGEVRQCHAALLYADEVRLVSPRAALLNSALDLSKLAGLDLLRECGKLAPKLAPDSSAAIRLMVLYADFPQSLLLTEDVRDQHREIVEKLAADIAPIQHTLQENFNEVARRSGFDGLKLAIDEGVLTVEDIDGVDITNLGDDDGDPMVAGLLNRIRQVLTAQNEYPLFNSDANEIVRCGIEEGIFAPVPMARRLGADAAMANGLFDRLPNFPNASTDEILDVRRELREPLVRFRAGVRGLTTDLAVPPESEDFGGEIEDAWNNQVAPALDEIDELVRQNTSLSNLLGRAFDEPSGFAALGATGALGASLAVAAGPAIHFTAAAAFAVTTSVASARAYRAQGRALSDSTATQFYFLYGANARIG